MEQSTCKVTDFYKKQCFFSQLLVHLKGTPGAGEVTNMKYEVIPSHAFLIRSIPRRKEEAQFGGQVCLEGGKMASSHGDPIICDLGQIT